MSELLKMLLQRLLGRAVAYLCPGIDDEDPAIDDPVDEGADEGADETDEDPAPAGDDPTDDDPEPAPRTMTRGQKAIVELRERAKNAEKMAKEAKDELDAQRAQRNQRPDPTFAEEEAKLRDANTSDLEKWQINSNRALRQSQAQSQAALARAEDLSDKASYTQKSIKNPIYEKYHDRVEEKLAKIRAQGGNIDREFLLHKMIGEDVTAGKFTAKSAASTGTKTIARGKSPGARSDTPARGRMSDREKRAARLQDTQI